MSLFLHKPVILSDLMSNIWKIKINEFKKVSEAEKGLRSKALENNEKLLFKKRAIFLEPPYSWDYLGERGVLI